MATPAKVVSSGPSGKYSFEKSSFKGSSNAKQIPTENAPKSTSITGGVKKYSKEQLAYAASQKPGTKVDFNKKGKESIIITGTRTVDGSKYGKPVTGGYDKSKGGYVTTSGNVYPTSNPEFVPSEVMLSQKYSGQTPSTYTAKDKESNQTIKMQLKTEQTKKQQPANMTRQQKENAANPKPESNQTFQEGYAKNVTPQSIAAPTIKPINNKGYEDSVSKQSVYVKEGVREGQIEVIEQARVKEQANKPLTVDKIFIDSESSKVYSTPGVKTNVQPEWNPNVKIEGVTLEPRMTQKNMSETKQVFIAPPQTKPNTSPLKISQFYNKDINTETVKESQKFLLQERMKEGRLYTQSQVPVGVDLKKDAEKADILELSNQVSSYNTKQFLIGAAEGAAFTFGVGAIEVVGARIVGKEAVMALNQLARPVFTYLLAKNVMEEGVTPRLVGQLSGGAISTAIPSLLPSKTSFASKVDLSKTKIKKTILFEFKEDIKSPVGVSKSYVNRYYTGDIIKSYAEYKTDTLKLKLDALNKQKLDIIGKRDVAIKMLREARADRKAAPSDLIKNLEVAKLNVVSTLKESNVGVKYIQRTPGELKVIAEKQLLRSERKAAKGDIFTTLENINAKAKFEQVDVFKARLDTLKSQRADILAKKELAIKELRLARAELKAKPKGDLVTNFYNAEAKFKPVIEVKVKDKFIDLKSDRKINQETKGDLIENLELVNLKYKIEKSITLKNNLDLLKSQKADILTKKEIAIQELKNTRAEIKATPKRDLIGNLELAQLRAKEGVIDLDVKVEFKPQSQAKAQVIIKKVRSTPKTPEQVTKDGLVLETIKQPKQAEPARYDLLSTLEVKKAIPTPAKKTEIRLVKKQISNYKYKSPYIEESRPNKFISTTTREITNKNPIFYTRREITPITNTSTRISSLSSESFKLKADVTTPDFKRDVVFDKFKIEEQNKESITQPDVKPDFITKSDSATKSDSFVGTDSIVQPDYKSDNIFAPIYDTTPAKDTGSKSMMNASLIKQTPELKKKRILESYPLSDKKRKGGLFSVFVRSKGMFKNIGQAKTQEEAFVIGQSKVFNTAAASFKIESESGQSVRPAYNPSKIYISKKEPGVFIQKNKFRISSPGEKGEITAKGIAANRFKGIFKRR
jgi:hypothetical protein